MAQATETHWLAAADCRANMATLESTSERSTAAASGAWPDEVGWGTWNNR